MVHPMSQTWKAQTQDPSMVRPPTVHWHVTKNLKTWPVKFEQIPLYYPCGCAAPQCRIAPIATLERFVVYCSSELIISGHAPGRGQEGTSCYGPSILPSPSLSSFIPFGVVYFFELHRAPPKYATVRIARLKFCSKWVLNWRLSTVFALSPAGPWHHSPTPVPVPRGGHP